MTADPLHQLSIGRIIDFLTNNRLPGMFLTREIVVAGGFLRRERARLIPARRLVRAQDFARHQTRGPAGRAADEIRAGRQSEDRQGDGVEHPRIFPAARR